MIKYFLIAVISVLFVKDLLAQKLIFGQVLDGAIREPLPYVNVYINNSTIGTVTKERRMQKITVTYSAKACPGTFFFQ